MLEPSVRCGDVLKSDIRALFTTSTRGFFLPETPGWGCRCLRRFRTSSRPRTLGSPVRTSQFDLKPLRHLLLEPGQVQVASALLHRLRQSSVRAGRAFSGMSCQLAGFVDVLTGLAMEFRSSLPTGCRRKPLRRAPKKTRPASQTACGFRHGLGSMATLAILLRRSPTPAAHRRDAGTELGLASS